VSELTLHSMLCGGCEAFYYSGKTRRFLEQLIIALLVNSPIHIKPNALYRV
jgi:hypothetical protein